MSWHTNIYIYINTWSSLKIIIDTCKSQSFFPTVCHICRESMCFFPKTVVLWLIKPFLLICVINYCRNLQLEDQPRNCIANSWVTIKIHTVVFLDCLIPSKSMFLFMNHQYPTVLLFGCSYGGFPTFGCSKSVLLNLDWKKPGLFSWQVQVS